MNIRKLAQACRIMADVRDVPTADVRAMADRAPLLAMPASEARTLRAVAGSREARDGARTGRAYVARSVSQRTR
jgi:hypothetical protein